MTPLESKFCAVLDEAQPLLKPVHITTEKWVVINATQMQTKEFLDEKLSITHSFFSAHDSITKLPSFIEAHDLFNKDEIFLSARTTAGYWGQFGAIFQFVLIRSGKLKKASIEIDLSKAVRIFRKLRQDFQKTALHYGASARLMGLRLSRKAFPLADGVTVHRLTRSELNRRQPSLDVHTSGWITHQYTGHPTELRLQVTVPVDLQDQNAHFTANNSAYEVASTQFQRIVDAIQIAVKGNVVLGPIDVTGGIEIIGHGQQLPQETPPGVNITLGQSAVQKVLKAYKLVTDANVRDKTLDRSLHRFLLGRKRKDLVDKLVDYVIAWEVLVLTNNGSALTQELSYRFSLNGATLISKTTSKSVPRNIFLKMRSGYDARSTIVHGGSEARIKKSLSIGNYENTTELCEFLEESYRNVVLWLSSIPAKERPYLKKGGWESLIWP